MSSGTVHVVVVFRRAGDNIRVGQPLQASSADAAVTLARTLAAKDVRVIAWSLTAHPDTGEYGDPVELVRIGTPDWFDESRNAGDKSS